LISLQSDVTPPALTSITIDAQSGQWSARLRHLLGRSRNHRRHHGFDWGYVSFVSPSGKQDVSGSIIPTPISGTAQKRCFPRDRPLSHKRPKLASGAFPPWSSGTAAGNTRRRYFPQSLTARGFQITATVISLQSDVTAACVDLDHDYAQSGQCQLVCRHLLGRSRNHRRHHGFRLGVCQFRESVGQARRERKHIPTPISGTARNGVFRATVTIPQAAEAGLWSISALVLQDAAGNSATLFPGGPDRAGISNEITVSVGTATISIGPPNLSF